MSHNKVAKIVEITLIGLDTIIRQSLLELYVSKIISLNFLPLFSTLCHNIRIFVGKDTKILHNIVIVYQFLVAMKQYIELQVACPSEEIAEIITAYLADYEFESFDTTAEAEGVTLYAYRKSEDWESCRIEAIEAIEEFGKSFQPVEIDNSIVIRAPHHAAPAPSIIDIIVTPKMSFGSGHHHTTRMMCRHILDCKASGRALDVGCGTGVLSIAALKCGAEWVDAIDIDIWSTESAREAAELNGISDKMEIILGTVEKIEGRTYDLVMANINRNIILEDIARYEAALNDGGTLLLSGFLEGDVEEILAATNVLNLKLVTKLQEEEWVALKLTK